MLLVSHIATLTWPMTGIAALKRGDKLWVQPQGSQSTSSSGLLEYP